MKKVIAFIGYSGSGKDFEARKYLQQDFEKIRMSQAVQDIVYKQLGINEQELEYQDLKNNMFWLPNTYFTGRDLMNGLTEGINEIDPTFWFRIWREKVIKSKCNVVVTDVRYVQSVSFLFHPTFETKIYFCNYKSNRYKIQNNVTEEMITDILKLKPDLNHLDDITELVYKNFVLSELSELLDSFPNNRYVI
jgi:hypothetical protein